VYIIHDILSQDSVLEMQYSKHRPYIWHFTGLTIKIPRLDSIVKYLQCLDQHSMIACDYVYQRVCESFFGVHFHNCVKFTFDNIVSEQRVILVDLTNIFP
jgi:hypothetical protein